MGETSLEQGVGEHGEHGSREAKAGIMARDLWLRRVAGTVLVWMGECTQKKLLHKVGEALGIRRVTARIPETVLGKL